MIGLRPGRKAMAVHSGRGAWLAGCLLHCAYCGWVFRAAWWWGRRGPFGRASTASALCGRIMDRRLSEGCLGAEGRMGEFGHPPSSVIGGQFAPRDSRLSAGWFA